MNDQPAKVVIGANYGDEGKGREVDRLTRGLDKPALVVRYNSSAQAGHTVVKGEHRHVFSHFGSGTLNGAHTLLTHRFVAVPTAFREEHRKLQSLLAAAGVSPGTVAISSHVDLATPLDALLNQLQERALGDFKHGSCGLGFGESIKRSEAGLPLTVYDLYPNTAWPQAVEQLTKRHLNRHVDYTIEQIIKRGIAPKFDVTDPLSRVWVSLNSGDWIWDPWLQCCQYLLENTVQVSNGTTGRWIKDEETVVFEGAQGLRLHEGLPEPYFPHVTWARTGCEDVVELLRELRVERILDLHYCTRSYATRHGEGPFREERFRAELLENGINPSCETNVANEHQGAMRFGKLNLTELNARIERDVRAGRYVNRYQDIGEISLTYSHCDQLDRGRFPDFRERLLSHLDPLFTTLILGFGPDSADSEVIERRAPMGGAATTEAVEPTVETEAPAAEAEATKAGDEGSTSAEAEAEA